MNFNPVGWFEIPATDLERAKKFYESLFNKSAEFPDSSAAGMNAELGEGGRGNGSFPVAEGSESASVGNRGVSKIKVRSPNTLSALLRG